MNNDDVVDHCEAVRPSIIYMAIGCGQGFYEPNKHSPQEYPPFMNEFEGHQICILIDPLLETPSRAYADLGLTYASAGAEPLVQIGRVSFIPIRRNFDWNSPEDIAFIDRLCALCTRESCQLIVQDYTGAYIDKYYPINRFGPILTRRVLFDVTYDDGGCNIDLYKVRVLRKPDGSFVQPKYSPISASPALSAITIKRRNDIVVNYVQRLHRIQTGLEEERDWCDADIVWGKIAELCHAYSAPRKTDTPSLERLMIAYLFDLCECVGDYMSEEDGLALIHTGGKEFEQALKMLILCCE